MTAFPGKLSPIVAVLGPTGAGKTELGLTLARKFDGEIISCDSIQVYRGFDIGSAKLPVAQRRDILHHLIDIIGIGEELTAGAYSRLAREAISAIQKRGWLPIVVGGTGLYLRALLDGLSPAPVRNEAVRMRLRAIASRRPAALHRYLRGRDPEAASRIHPNDRQKLIRAIELVLLAGQSATVTQSLPRNSMPDTLTLKLGLAPDRTLLYEHLDRRSAWMFANGLLGETKALLDSGISPAAKPLQSLGYRQAAKVLTRQFTLDQAIRECQVRTRQYAKRQMTWFRAEPGVHWLPGFGTDSLIQARALELTQNFLRTEQLLSPLNSTNV